MHLEREYQRFSRQLISDLKTTVVYALPRAHQRLDAADDAADESERGLTPALEALLLALGLRARDLVDEKKLRRKLRSIATRLSTRQRAELQRLLQRPVKQATAATLDAWVESQVLELRSRVKTFAAKVDEVARTPGLPFEELTSRLNRVATVQATTAAFFASSAVLTLNSMVTQEMVVPTGATHYVWRTQLDEKTRDWHADLDGTVQAWNAPPMGGGTSAEYPGHPGEGLNCRCIADPVT